MTSKFIVQLMTGVNQPQILIELFYLLPDILSSAWHITVVVSY
jgi:hypothetical protein